jgi:hypothetical protein
MLLGGIGSPCGRTGEVRKGATTITRPTKAGLQIAFLLASAAGVLWAVTPAGATHIPGATYDGTLTGAGTITFAVSRDESSISYLRTPPIPTNCGYNMPGIAGSYDVPITNHQFDDSTPPIYFSGRFVEENSASGTFRIAVDGCDTGFLSWKATATPPPTCKGEYPTVVTQEGHVASYVTTGTNGNDVIMGTSKKDTIKAKGGNDTVCAKGGNDTVKGGGGKDKLYGQGGKDKLYGQGGKDNLAGGGGKDTCVGAGGNDSANCETEKSV